MPLEIKQISLAGLSTLEVTDENPDFTVILFHGYGADANDLVPLAQAYKGAKVKLRWLFPTGPLEIPIGPNYSGRAWFPIDIDRLKKAVAEKSEKDLILAFPNFDEARRRCESLIAELNIPHSNLILGGFSQGAMLATDIALHSFQRVGALLVFSGMLLDKEEWERLSQLQKGLAFFQSHGEGDPLIPFLEGKKLETFFKKSGFEGSMFGFKGGHEIPLSVLMRLNLFLRAKFQD